MMGALLSLSTPAAAQADPGLISATEYESPQFEFTLAWDDPWSVVEDSVTSEDDQFDTIDLETPNAYLDIILVFGADAEGALEILLENTEQSGENVEEIGSDAGDGFVSSTVEFTFTSSSGREVLFRKYHEVGAIDAINGESALFAATLLAQADNFEDEWNSLVESVERDGRNPVFLGTPEGIRGSSTTSRDEPNDSRSRSGGIDGDQFTGPIYGFSVQWDADLWEAEDLSDKSTDKLLLISDTAEIEIGSFRTKAGDLRTCATDNANILRETEGITRVGRETNYPLPDTPKDAFSRLYHYTDTTGRRDVVYLQYFECRPLAEETFLKISFKAAAADYEDELPNYQDVIDTLELGGKPPAGNGTDNGNTGNRGRAPVLSDTSYTGGAFDFTVEFDDAIWTPEEQEPEEGYEGVLLDSRNTSVWIEAIASFDGDPDECIEAAADGLANADGISRVREQTRIELPETDPDAVATLFSFTLATQDQNGDDIDIAIYEYVECRVLVDGEAVLRISAYTSPDVWEDELPALEDLLAGITIGDDGSADAGSSSSAKNRNASKKDNAKGTSLERPVIGGAAETPLVTSLSAARMPALDLATGRTLLGTLALE